MQFSMLFCIRVNFSQSSPAFAIGESMSAFEAGGFPIMTLPLGFLMKDVLFLAASFYLLKQDLVRAALDIERS